MTQEQLDQNWHRVKHYLAVRQYPKAVALAGEMVAAYPENSRSRLLLISALYDSDSRKEALQVTRDLLAIDPENSTAWHWMALLAPKNKEKRAAIERAITLRPNSADFHAEKAWVLIRQKWLKPWVSWRNVEKSALRALEINPNHRQAHIYLSRAIMADRKRLGEAKHHCELVLRDYPEDATAMRGLAQIEALERHHDNAKEILEQSLQVDPNNNWAQYKLRQQRKFAERDEIRSRHDRFMSSIYDRLFGRWPIFVPFVLLLAGFITSYIRFIAFMISNRNWEIIDVFMLLAWSFCLIELKFAIRPLLKFVPRKWLPG